MRYVYLLAALAFGAVAPLGAQSNGLLITNYQFQSETRISVNVYDVTYSATLVNTTAPKGAVTAKVTSRSESGNVVAGKDVLHFGPIANGGQVQSTDTFTLRVDRSQSFFFAQLDWAFTVAPTGPTANAGLGQTGPVGATITLNGSGSTSPGGGGSLTYNWEFTSKPISSAASLTNANTVSPNFVIDKFGTYVAKLTVSNGLGSNSATVTINTSNSAPVSNAGPNQTVAVGSTVTLNGAGSSDVDGNPLTYTWTMISKPTTGVGSAAILSSGTAVSPTFVADRAGTYVVQLVVRDGSFNSAPSIVTINTSNTNPVSNAGPDQVVPLGGTVSLTGAGSTDVDGDPLTYQWSLITLPAGSTATLTGATSVTPTFTADLAGNYVAQLIVNDGKINSNTDTVSISTNSTQPPTANAGSNQNTAVNSTITLHGSGTDPQSLALTYHWSLITRPANSTATLSSLTAQEPTFIADKTGDYVAQLIVNNGTLNSAPKTVTVTTTVSAPTANAGPDQTKTGTGASVNLTGVASTDPQSLVLTYAWSLTTRPAGSAATLTGATTVAPAFVADKLGTYVAQLIVNNGFLGSEPKTVTITVQQGPATQIAATSGSGQTAALNATFGSVLVATVKDAQGLGVPGKVVTFTANTVAGATGTFGSSATTTATTDASGVATSSSFKANGTPGSYTVSATIPGLLSAATFSFTNSAPGPTLTVVSGSGQSVKGRAMYPQPLSVRMLSGTGTPVVGTTVTFNIIASGQTTGSFQPNDNTAVTDSTGLATSNAVVSNNPAKIGTFTVSATAPGVSAPAVFSLSIAAKDPSTVTLVSGSPQTSPANQVFADRFKVLVKDDNDNPVQGITVFFTPPGGTGPGGSFAGGVATATTIADGTATSQPFTANNKEGGYQVSAFVSGVPATVPFSLINSAALPNTIAVTSGTPQTSSANTAFSAPLVATVKNGNNQPVAGTTVTFVAPASGASGTFPGNATTVQVVTSDTGVATSPVFTANCTLGNYSVKASATGSPQVDFALTNVAGAATSIALATTANGNNQSAGAGTAFGSPLSVIVKDACGSPVSGVTVTFTAPGADVAGGTFAAGAVTTNSSGIAVSNVFTANTKTGAYTVTAAFAGVATPASFSLTNTAGPASTITVNGGGTQSAAINAAFGAPLSVIVKDSYGNPVPNATIAFTTPAQTLASGTFAAGTVTTNASGIANSTTFTANSKMGAYQVTATVTGATIATPASFSLTNTHGPAASITITGGDAQSAPVGTAFTAPLKVTVKDAGGNVISGAAVTFAGPVQTSASATFATNPATTDASGIASVVATANGVPSVPGEHYSVTATVTGVAPATFTLSNLSGPPAAVVALPNTTPQAAGINTAFATNLGVKVTDASGLPVFGINVVFAAPAGGASGTFAGPVSSITVPTNASGIANAPVFTANGTVSATAYNVTATVASLPVVNFALTNLPGPPASVTVVAGTDSQTAKVGAAYALQPAVLVKDAAGNVLSGVAVKFTAPAANASGTFLGNVAEVTVNTLATGIATAPPFTANNKTGLVTIAVAVSPIVNPPSFTFTNTPGAVASVKVTGLTSPQSAAVTTAYAQALMVTVTDSFDNAIPNQTVTFTAPTAGTNIATGTFPGAVTTTTVTTTAAGTASVVFTAGTVAGVVNVAAAVGAVGANPPFVLTNLPGTAASIAVVAGNNQHTPRGSAFTDKLVAIVKDAQANVIPGKLVTFTVIPSGNATATFAGGVNTATTIANGTATSAILTASTTAGTYTVKAEISGLSSNASFTLTNDPPPPASISVGGGSPQTTFINTMFNSPVIATVRDANGEGVLGKTVTFTLPATGASATFGGGLTTVTAVTDANGRAQIQGTNPLGNLASGITANGQVGTFTMTASVVGVEAKASYSFTNVPPPVANTIQVSSGALGKDMYSQVIVNLPFAVPSGGAAFTYSSSDPSKLLVTGQAGAVGSASVSTDPLHPVAEGTTQFSFLVQALSESGSAQVTVSSPSYPGASGTGTITLSPSGFVLSGPNGVGNSFNTNSNVSTPLTVTAVRLDASSKAPVETQQLRAGVSVTVGITASGGTTVVACTVDGLQTTCPITSVTFTGGDTQSKSFNFVAGTPGSASIVAVVPVGFTTPASGANMLSVTINQPTLNIPNVSIGKGRQVLMTITVTGAAPAQGQNLRLTSADPSRLRFSKSQSQAGRDDLPYIDLGIQPGGNRTGNFYAQAYDDSGTVTFTADAGTLGTGTGTATLTPSGVVLIGPGNNQSGLVTTSVGLQPTAITVAAAQVVNGTWFTQEVAGGQTVTVALTTLGTSGTINPATVSISAGNVNTVFGFTPLQEGATNITAAVPAGGIATPLQTIAVKVNPPTMSISGNNGQYVHLGKNLQVQGVVNLIAAAPANDDGGLKVTLTSSDPTKLLLSTTAGATGTATIQVIVPTGTNSVTYYLQSRTDSGDVQYTSQAAGYGTTFAGVTMKPSGIALSAPTVGQNTFWYTVGGPAVGLFLYPVMSDDGVFQQQLLSGGVDVTVSVDTNPHNVYASVPAAVTITGGTAGAPFDFTPAATGGGGSGMVFLVGTPAGYVSTGSKSSANFTLMPSF